MRIQIQETDSDDTWLTDNADSTGSFTDTSFSIQDNDGGVKFVMTATGQTSGETAQYRFTDSVTCHRRYGHSSDTVTVGAGATANYLRSTSPDIGARHRLLSTTLTTTSASGDDCEFHSEPSQRSVQRYGDFDADHHARPAAPRQPDYHLL